MLNWRCYDKVYALLEHVYFASIIKNDQSKVSPAKHEEKESVSMLSSVAKNMFLGLAKYTSIILNKYTSIHFVI